VRQRIANNTFIKYVEYYSPLEINSLQYDVENKVTLTFLVCDPVRLGHYKGEHRLQNGSYLKFTLRNVSLGQLTNYRV
jgi:hypothetical protein